MPSAHPAANLFPMLSSSQLRELAKDIEENGLKQTIVMLGDQILDGRNRWRACEMAGVSQRTESWEGTDPVAYVVSLNLKRRHLNESQRAMVAAKIATLRKGRPEQNAEIYAFVKTQAKAAELLNVSRESVQYARKVVESGAAELAAIVEAGEVAVSNAALIAEQPKAEQQAIVARGEKEVLRAAKEIRARKQELRRQQRVRQLAEISKATAPLLKTGQKYPLLYADPPWRYEHVETESRAIENQYPTMSLEEICALPIENVCLDDCVLFMWATSPKLAEAFQVLVSWGFSYRTCAVWVKDKIGMGYYFRQQHELLLVATRGNPPVPGTSDRVSSVFKAVRGEHSAKPVEAYRSIERMYPSLPKLELFARKARSGWASWGNQKQEDGK